MAVSTKKLFILVLIVVNVTAFCMDLATTQNNSTLPLPDGWQLVKYQNCNSELNDQIAATRLIITNKLLGEIDPIIDRQYTKAIENLHIALETDTLSQDKKIDIISKLKKIPEKKYNTLMAEQKEIKKLIDHITKDHNPVKKNIEGPTEKDTLKGISFHQLWRPLTSHAITEGEKSLNDIIQRITISKNAEVIKEHERKKLSYEDELNKEKINITVDTVAQPFVHNTKIQKKNLTNALFNLCILICNNLLQDHHRQYIQEATEHIYDKQLWEKCKTQLQSKHCVDIIENEFKYLKDYSEMAANPLLESDNNHRSYSKENLLLQIINRLIEKITNAAITPLFSHTIKLAKELCAMIKSYF